MQRTVSGEEAGKEEPAGAFERPVPRNLDFTGLAFKQKLIVLSFHSGGVQTSAWKIDQTCLI